MSGFRFVDDHQADYRITDLCRVAKVSQSSYFAWRSRPLSARAVADAKLLEVIREIHHNSRGTYGAPQMRGQIRRAGHYASRHRVARLMATEGLVGASSSLSRLASSAFMPPYWASHRAHVDSAISNGPRVAQMTRATYACSVRQLAPARQRAVSSSRSR